VLTNPPLRFRMGVQALLRGDSSAYVRIRRLHAAQLDLAFARWRRERGDPQSPECDRGAAAADSAAHDRRDPGVGGARRPPGW